MMIAQEAFDLIVKEEVSGREYYESRLTHPEWPGLQSGITIGIGYDLGQSTAAQIEADWKDQVSPTTLAVMKQCAGITGAAAHRLLPSVKVAINIPWNAAIAVFSNRDVPRWTAIVLKALPNADKLNPLCLGVLVSLAYNRGASFQLQGDRYREMRAIRDLCIAQNFDGIPAQLEAMARLWPTMTGLRDRRMREAALFRKGLAQPASAPVTSGHPPPLPPPPPQSPQPAPTAPVSFWAWLLGLFGRY